MNNTDFAALLKKNAEKLAKKQKENESKIAAIVKETGLDVTDYVQVKGSNIRFGHGGNAEGLDGMRGQITNFVNGEARVQIAERRLRNRPTTMNERKVTSDVCIAISLSIESTGVKGVASSIIDAIFSYFTTEDGFHQWAETQVVKYTRNPGAFNVPLKHLVKITAKEFMEYRRYDVAINPNSQVSRIAPQRLGAEFLAKRLKIMKAEKERGQ